MLSFAGKTVRCMPEWLRGFMTRRYINPRYFYLWGLTALPTQIGYIVPIISKTTFKSLIW